MVSNISPSATPLTATGPFAFEGSLSEGELAQIAAKIGPVLAAGDCVLLEGDLGAGKTAFARCLIQQILLEHEDVPSPTFTLVQTYDTVVGPLWHVDLYRLGGANDLIELGLHEAIGSAITLIEWPQILNLSPSECALSVALAHCEDPARRRVRFETHLPRLAEAIACAVAP